MILHDYLLIGIFAWFFLWLIFFVVFTYFKSRNLSRTRRALSEKKVKKIYLFVLIAVIIITSPVIFFLWAFGIFMPIIWIGLFFMSPLLPSNFRKKTSLSILRWRDNMTPSSPYESKKLMDLIDSVDTQWARSITFIPNWLTPFQLSTYNSICLAVYIIKTKWKNNFQPGELQKIFTFIYNFLESSNIDLFEKATKYVQEFVKVGGTIQINYK